MEVPKRLFPMPKVIIDLDLDPESTVVEITFGDRLGALLDTPFLDVIQSDETGAPITGVALSFVYKFLTLGIIEATDMNVDNALHQIADVVTSCCFEVTDPASEEVVLMKILQVLLACKKSEASKNLTNHNVCNIVNVCFRLVQQASAKSELLQRIVRHMVNKLVRCIFILLPNIESRVYADPERYLVKEGDIPTIPGDYSFLEASRLRDPVCFDNIMMTRPDCFAIYTYPLS
ncbi:hypothetical protein CQW23_01242 [Capsicum baccatum]|uniref:Uncharacterized protein n=1 Tax=Capsicum baccatum TaxID=33114 RepID=A0A2G2XN54_CAPBA|nr:hypothetical protein CQW23_01242 [Capsicum baccatum]